VQKGEQFSKRNNSPKHCTVNTYTVSGFRELQKIAQVINAMEGI